MKVAFTADANADLRGIALFIARNNRIRAQSFVRELRQKAKELGDNPNAFAVLPRYEHQGLRRRPFGDYLIFYRVDADAVIIIRILHGARDYDVLLNQLLSNGST